MAFRFTLQKLLEYREHQRELVRQELAQLLAQEARCAQRRDQCLEERAASLREMADLQSVARMSIDAAAARRFFASHMAQQARQAEQDRLDVLQQVAACRQKLLTADQGVKVLEQLRERHHTEFLTTQESRESRAREEAWQAGQLLVDRQEQPVLPDSALPPMRQR
jgi:flagellar export protein FliJ